MAHPSTSTFSTVRLSGLRRQKDIVRFPESTILECCRKVLQSRRQDFSSASVSRLSSWIAMALETSSMEEALIRPVSRNYKTGAGPTVVFIMHFALCTFHSSLKCRVV